MTKANKHISPAQLDAAVAWYCRLNGRDTTDADIERHMEWLLEDAAHMDAYDHISATLADADDFEAQARKAFAADFKGRQQIAEPTSFWSKLFGGGGLPSYAYAGAVAALLLIAFVPGMSFLNTTSDALYYSANDVGIRTVTLADGSHIYMFEGSEFSVDFAKDARRVTLAKGRVCFEVVSDASRPFYVETGTRRIKVVGTQFEVIRAPGFDRIAVREGLVAVASLSQTVSQDPIFIKPGASVRYDSADELPVVGKQDPTSVGAWKEGILVFEKQPLSEVVVRINKLFPKVNLILGEAALEKAAFSGTLVVSDAETMVRQLAEFLSLKVTATDNRIMLTSK